MGPVADDARAQTDALVFARAEEVSPRPPTEIYRGGGDD